MLPLILQVLGEQASKVVPLVWNKRSVDPQDRAAMKHEALSSSNFDTMKMREGMWNAQTSGKADLVAWECSSARVTAILPKGARGPPLDLWGAVIGWFGPPSNGGIWKIQWQAHPKKREQSPSGTPLGPESVNGGQTLPCSSQGIFIYRHEEATRVLIHEMLHASCLDPHGESLPVREATIETWAELIQVALLSKGRPSELERLWKLQADWVVSSNAIARRDHRVHGPQDQAWRQKVGREAVQASLGVELPAHGMIRTRSSRFTHPSFGAV